MEERRNYPRARGDLEWLFVIQINSDEKQIITETKDISCTGIRCTTDEYFAKDSFVDLVLLLPLTEKGLLFEKVRCKGKTVRCSLVIGQDKREAYETAFEFVDIDTNHIEKISKYVKYVEEINHFITQES